MKNCYAVHLIRWFNSLPDVDNRISLLRLWHRMRGVHYYTKESFFMRNQNNLARHIIDNRHIWTDEELEYENRGCASEVFTG